jgi:HTH-type transcriptional regulator/antitoxin HigA
MAETLTAAEVFSPGEYLRDELSARGWTEKEFAGILGRPVQAVSEILNGRKQIVPETAVAIGEAFGTSAEVWMNLQSAFNLHQAKSNRPAVTDVHRRSRLRSCVPVTELRRRGWLPDTDNLNILEAATLSLLGVDDLEAQPSFAIAARRSNEDAELTPQQIAWLARVKRIAESKSVPSYDARAADALANELVHRLHGPTELSDIASWLASCGIVLVNLLPLKSSKMDGATMFLDDGTPVIGLSSRHDRMDGYVFTLLHEMAHLLLGHIDECGITIDEDIDGSNGLTGREKDANDAAAAWILPTDATFPPGHPTLSAIIPYAGRYRVHPCFIIGRIQRDRQDWSLLRRQIPRVRPFVSVES